MSETSQGPANPRVGIVGARRVHQGLGPYVARDFTHLGAKVVCVLGTTDASAEEARDQVERAAGMRPDATADPQAFDALDLDVVCVLSPAGTHLEHVERALAAGRHVLCEKPFLWTPETEWAATAADLEDRFAARGLVLAVNAQWPWVLPAFEEVTGALTAGARSLAMGLAPASKGARMIGDALPHPLSLAQALHPELETARAIRFEHPHPEMLRIQATLAGPSCSLDLDVHFDGRVEGAAEGAPREAWLEIDGARAERCIRTRDYAMFLRAGARIVDLADPLTARIKSFLASVAAARSDGRPDNQPDNQPDGLVPDRSISRRAALMADMSAAFLDTFPDAS